MGLFDFLKPKTNVKGERLYTNIQPTTPLPSFKYLRDSRVAFEPNYDKERCECCEKIPDRIYKNGIYAVEEVENLCAECIISGEAAKKFNGTFNEADNPAVDDLSAKEELEKRTPTLNTWQEIEWVACCKDFCQFVKFMTEEDFKDADLLKSLKETYDEEEEGIPFRKLQSVCQKSEDTNFLLFQCPTCKKYYVKVDLD